MNDLFLRALRQEPVDRLPVWIMRQAGRYLPQYRAIREKVAFLDLCQNPELAAEVTLQPIDAIGVDAAILFSDIMVPLLPAVPGLHFDPGPRFKAPVTNADQIRKTDPVSDNAYVAETIRLLRRELSVPLIGFAGAPVTVATYLAEGGSAKHFTALRKLMLKEPAAAHKLLERLEELTLSYLQMQIAAGAQAVQIFDSWGGQLSQDLFDTFAAPGLERLVLALRESVPVIYFAKGPLRDVGATAYGVDWVQDLAAARSRGSVQGNLDPAVLLSDPDTVAAAARRMAEPLAGTGYVANLGHGILPETPVECARAFVDAIHDVPVPAA